jgi:hypothetical protein
MPNISKILFSCFGVSIFCLHPGLLIAQTPTRPQSIAPSDLDLNPVAKTNHLVVEKLNQYLSEYPDLKLYLPKLLSQTYPPGITCSKFQHPPFIVLILAFPIPSNSRNLRRGYGISPFRDDDRSASNSNISRLAHQTLLSTAISAGFSEVDKADEDRPSIDKNRLVLYRYRVQFEPKTGKY